MVKVDRSISRAEERSEEILKFYKHEAFVPRFIVVERTDGGDFCAISPIILSRSLNDLIGKPKSVKKDAKTLLVETISGKQSTELLISKFLASFPVKVTPHDTLNISVGTIFCEDLANCTQEELLSELTEQGVFHIKPVTTWKQDLEVNTGKIILAFNLQHPPPQVEIGFYKLEVLPIPTVTNKKDEDT